MYILSSRTMSDGSIVGQIVNNQGEVVNLDIAGKPTGGVLRWPYQANSSLTIFTAGGRVVDLGDPQLDSELGASRPGTGYWEVVLEKALFYYVVDNPDNPTHIWRVAVDGADKITIHPIKFSMRPILPKFLRGMLEDQRRELATA